MMGYCGVVGKGEKYCNTDEVLSTEPDKQEMLNK